MAVADDPSLDLGTGDFALAFWVRTSDADGVKVVLDKRVPGVIQGYHAYLWDGRPGLQLADDATGSDNFVASRSVADGTWHFVTMAVDRDDPEGLRIRVDLLPAEVFDPTVRPGSLDNDAELTLGRRSAGFGEERWFSGELDEVRVIGWAATPAYLASLYFECTDVAFNDGFETGDLTSWPIAVTAP